LTVKTFFSKNLCQTPLTVPKL